MLPVLQLGPLAVQLPGLLLIAGVWLGTMLIDRAAARYGLAADDLTSMVFYSLLAGLLGARLGYVLRFPDVYLGDPLAVVSLNTFTLSLPEGFLAGGVAALIYGRGKGLPLWDTLDALTPSLALMGVTVALAHISSGDAFGSLTDLPWAVELWGGWRHPTQIYELIIVVSLLIYAWRGRAPGPFPGYRFLTWAAMFALGRVFLEAFRGDSQVILGVLRRAQVTALLSALAALWALHLRGLNHRAATD